MGLSERMYKQKKPAAAERKRGTLDKPLLQAKEIFFILSCLDAS